MRASRYLPYAVAPLAAAMFACSAPVAASDGADAEALGPATAVVVVERTSGPGADDGRAEAVARFVQMRSGAVDDQALRMVGAAVDFPALGACAAQERPRYDAAGLVSRAVKLADVGAVSLESNGVRTSLLARQVPDVADLVSGVVYTARGEAALAPRALYVLRGAGTASVEPFEVLANAPAEPTDVRVAGQDAGGAIALTKDGAVDLGWEPGSMDDVVYVDVAANDTATPTVRCLFGDTGRAIIPAAALGAIDAGTLTLHRLHRESFRAKGIDTGEIRFDFARAAEFTRK